MLDEAGAWDSTYHAPVLVSEIVAALAGAPRILDGTLGGGGHTAALLDAGATVDALDRDLEAVRASRVRLSGAEAAGRFRAFTANFAALDTVSELRGIHYNGMLLDLGVSSHQVDDLTRGFSFRPGALLDMRMARQQASQEAPPQTITPAIAGAAGAGHEPDAAGLLNTAPELDLIAIFRTYADEPRAGRLAREIVRRRASRPFATSDDLVGAIRGAFGARTGPPDFARLFQAVRIAVNDEIATLTAALPLLRDRLAPGRPARGHRVPLGRRPRREAHLSRMEPGLPLPAAPGLLHLRRRRHGRGDHTPGGRRSAGGGRAQPPRPEREVARVAPRRMKAP